MKDEEFDYNEYMGLTNEEDDCYQDTEVEYDNTLNLDNEFEEYTKPEIKVTTLKAKPRIINRRLKTRKGDIVKSKFERSMANYLFNRGIDYVYEPKLRLGKKLFKPDFYLSENKIYIECWGMNNMALYMKRRVYKEKVYNFYNIDYLSVNYKDMKKGRYHKILRKAGIINEGGKNV
jgi:hypothetical protein